MNPLTLSKDEVQKLRPDQQDMFAAMVARHAQHRLGLIEQARSYRGKRSFGRLLEALGSGLAIVSVVFPKALPFAIIAVSGAVTFHVAGTNQRLDALMELLDQEITQSPKKSPPDSGTT